MSSATSAVQNATSTWNIDPVHSSAHFKVRHMMVSNVRGEFSGITGAVALDSVDIANSKVEATIDASTISTRDAQRDGHLKSADFFDVEKYPTLSFKSTRISKTGDGELAVTGAMTIHGVTRNVTFEVEGPSGETRDPYGNTRIGLSATTRINRKDFGLVWNGTLETGGVLVGEEVTISLDLELIKA